MKIPTNQWGILNKDNCSDVSKIPKKVIDPLRRIRNSYGNQWAGEFGYENIGRNSRPSDEKPIKGVFKKIISGLQPEVIVCEGDKVYSNHFFLPEPDLHETDAPVIIIANKYPLGYRYADDYVMDLMVNNPLPDGEYYAFVPCFMTFPTATSESIGDFQLIERIPLTILELMLLSNRDMNKAFFKVASDMGISQVVDNLFINQGHKAAATIAEVHMQDYLDCSGSGHDGDFEILLRSFHDYGCRICKKEYEGRLLYENKSFVLYIEKVPSGNLRFAPKQHVNRFSELTDAQVSDLAEVIKIGNMVYSKAGFDLNRNIYFYSLPFGYKTKKFHLHGVIAPKSKERGSFEAGGRKHGGCVPSLEVLELLKKDGLDKIDLDNLGVNNYIYS